jgi:DNA-binding NarL/FixJ family response regulator
MEAIRIFIADDHSLFRDGLKALFKTLEDFEVVGEAATGDQAIIQVQTLQPDVVLMDINMPDVSGLVATERILQANPKTGVIMVTMVEDDASLFMAMCAGARGYVLKGADYFELLQAVRAVAAGQAMFGPAVAARMLHFFRELASQPELARYRDAFPTLTTREHEILELMAQGLGNENIAGKLGISSKTVRNHITSIFGKLQVSGRIEAVIRAREAGYGHGSEDTYSL